MQAGYLLNNFKKIREKKPTANRHKQARITSMVEVKIST